MNWREVEPDVTPITGNYSQYNETYWSSEDEDETKEGITPNRNEDLKIKPYGEDNINKSHDNNKSEEREVSTGLKQKKEKEYAANVFSKEEGTKPPDIYKEGEDNAHASSEDISSYSEDETTQQLSQNEVKHESGKSSGEGNELRAIHDTSSKAQTRADRPNTILFSKDKRMDTSLAP